MKKTGRYLLGAVVVLCLAGAGNAFAAQDMFKEHNKAMNSKADAQSTAVLGVYGNNMGKRIESGKAKGVLVKDGKSNNENVKVSGVGNVVVEKDAKITGPVIIKNDYSNAKVFSR